MQKGQLFRNGRTRHETMATGGQASGDIPKPSLKSLHNSHQDFTRHAARVTVAQGGQTDTLPFTQQSFRFSDNNHFTQRATQKSNLRGSGSSGSGVVRRETIARCAVRLAVPTWRGVPECDSRSGRSARDVRTPVACDTIYTLRVTWLMGLRLRLPIASLCISYI